MASLALSSLSEGFPYTDPVWGLPFHFPQSLHASVVLMPRSDGFVLLTLQHIHNMLYRRILGITHSCRFTTAWNWVEHFYALHSCMKHFHIHLLLYVNTCTHSTAVRNTSMPSMLPWSQAMLLLYYLLVKTHFHIWLLCGYFVTKNFIIAYCGVWTHDQKMCTTWDLNPWPS